MNPLGLPGAAVVRSDHLLAENLRNGAILGDRIVHADNFWLRLKGLLGRSALAPGEGLLLEPCNAIHTFFMAFAIDVAFLDRQNEILATLHSVAPHRMPAPIFRASRVLELRAGSLSASATKVGDQLRFR